MAILKDIIERIEKPILDAGYKKDDLASTYFHAAYTIRNMMLSSVFLIKFLEDEDVDKTAIKKIVDEGRQWCSVNLKATWAIKEAGLNIVLFHQGQVGTDDIKSQADKTGLHGSICQSITAINVIDGGTIIDKTWVVIGKTNKALNNIGHTFQ
jgi:hypothetical protein